MQKQDTKFAEVGRLEVPLQKLRRPTLPPSQPQCHSERSEESAFSTAAPSRRPIPFLDTFRVTDHSGATKQIPESKCVRRHFYGQPVVHSGFGEFAARTDKSWRVDELKSVMIRPALNFPSARYPNNRGKSSTTRA